MYLDLSSYLVDVSILAEVEQKELLRIIYLTHSGARACFIPLHMHDILISTDI